MSRSGQRGFVLVGVQVFVVVVFIALAPTYSRLHEALRVEKRSLNVLGDTATKREDALGTVVARLQTGVPPTDTFNCQLLVPKPNDTNMDVYVVTYEKLVVDEWRVTVTKDNSSTVSACPVMFGDQCPVVGS